MVWLYFGIGAAISAVIFFIIGRLAGIAHRKKVAEAEIGSAEEQAKRILEDSLKTAETKKKEALLAATGGIVQGMSGSPIIQDGKLVGAVTHVLVNDPTTGYGIFIENMLDAAA